MTSAPLRVLAALIACAGILCAGAIALTRDERPERSVPSVHATGPVPAGAVVKFTLLLALPGEGRLRHALAGIEDPRSPQYHHFIDPASFGARFGLTLAQLRALDDELAATGVRVLGGYPQRTQLRVSASAATVRRVFGVSLEGFTDSAGRRWHSPMGTPSLPASLRPGVRGVTGLDTRPRFVAHDVPMGGLTPALAASGYDVAGLHNLGISGQSQTIAIISFSGYDPGDPATFASSAGITGPEPRVVAVDGGTTDTSGAVEANLDIDIVRSIAPEAQILFYELPQTNAAYSDAINQIVASHVGIISSSWGQCELGVDRTELAADSQALQAAVAAGVSMFVSTGDSGAYDCQANDPADQRLSVDWPAASANAVAVGGTRLYLDQNGAYVQEAGWEDTLSAAGAGGGLTQRDPRPSWQAGAGVQSSDSNGRRQLPDVSAAADPGTPWGIYANGRAAEVGGTSAAAPFWAASMLLVGQYAAGRGAGRLGFVDPILYALASSAQAFPPFHDVTRGGNRHYQATAGWDFATGLGSPDVYNLARDMVAYLRAHPAR